MFAWFSLAYAFFMALVDTSMLGLVKDIYLNGAIMKMIIPTIFYAFQPWIFLSAMRFESLTIMNLMWDLMSDILVSLIGVFYFKEILTPIQMCGLFLGFISLLMMAYKG
jgi:multidrug transporter EmrE-like cation transporter